MKQTITASQFIDAIVGDEYNSMSREGAEALFEYLEELEDSCGEELEFDKVAIRCDFTEYENLDAVLHDYDCTLSELEDNTCVIEIEGTDRLIIQVF
jgi:hypothetical protein